MFLGSFGSPQVMESKMKEIDNWERNRVFEAVRNTGQEAINTRRIITEKVKEGKTVCKARLVARGFEKEGKEMETDVPTCASETLKLCRAKIVQEGRLGGLRSRLDLTVFHWKDKK